MTPVEFPGTVDETSHTVDGISCTVGEVSRNWMKFPILLVEFLVALVEFPGRVDGIVLYRWWNFQEELMELYYTVGGISRKS